MKKLNFRAILILLLVVVLAFALVACGDKDKDTDKGNNGGDTTNNGGNNNGGNNNGGNGNTDDDDAKNIANVKSYFNTLWNLTSGIGSEEVADNEDLAISLDLGIALETVDSFKKVYQSIDLGIGVEAILDRSSEGSSANTAFKISIHGKDNENWATFYYFFNDPSNIYIDFAGQNIVVPYNYESKDGSITPDQFKTLFYNFVNKDFESGALKDKSVMDIVAFFTDDLGADWTLNTLVTGVTKLFDLNLEELLYPTDPNAELNIGALIEQFIHISKEDMFDKGGNLDLEKILTNETIAGLLFKGKNTTVTEEGAHTEVDLGLLDLAQSLLKDWGEIINSNMAVELDYGIKDNQIDGFDIGVTFGSISAKVNKKSVMPKVTISINDLSIGKASKDDLKMATDRTNYSKEIAVDAKVALDLKGITIKLDALLDNEDTATAADENIVEAVPTYSDILLERLSAYLKEHSINGIALNDTLEIGVYGKVDIASRPDKDEKETNGTALKAWLKYGKDNIVEMSFVGDTIAVTLNQGATIGGVKVIDALVSLFGDKAYDLLVTYLKDEGQLLAGKLFTDDTHLAVNPDFKGAVWSGINLGKNFNDLVNMAINWIGGGTDQTPSETPTETPSEDPSDAVEEGATTSAETASTIKKIVSTISKAIPYINTENGLTIDVTGKTVGEAVAEIGKIWDEKMGKQENFINTIIDSDKNNVLAVIIKMIDIEGSSYASATGATKDNPTPTQAEVELAQKKAFFQELFASNAKINLNISDEGITLDVDVDVNKDCSVGLSIDFSVEKIDESKIINLGKDVTAESDGWYYYAF